MTRFIEVSLEDYNAKTALLRRWNKAAMEAGYCGSEYMDNPELVFAAVQEHHSALKSALLVARRNSRGISGS